MEMAKSLLIVLIFCCCAIKVYSLQCYTCVNCGSGVKEDYLQTCGAPDITTIAPTTSPASNTTTLPENSTETSSTTTTTPNTTTKPDTTTQTSTTEVTTTTVVTTLAPTNNTNTTTTKQHFAHNSTLTLNRMLEKKRRNTECSCEDIQCECNDETSSTTDFRGLRAISFTCFKVTYRKNNTDMIDRGCIPFPDIGKVCDFYPNSTQCTTCNSDKCNSAYSLKSALLPIIITACVTFKNAMAIFI